MCLTAYIVIVFSAHASSGFFPLDSCHVDDDLLLDISSNALTASHSGTSWMDGPFGLAEGAVLFLGSSDSYVEIPEYSELDVQTSMTILAHIYPTLAQDGPIAYWDISGSEGVSFRLYDTSGLRLTWTERDQSVDLDGIVIAEGIITYDTWNFVAATYDYETGDASIYVDGVLVSILFRIIPPHRKVVLRRKYFRYLHQTNRSKFTIISAIY